MSEPAKLVVLTPYALREWGGRPRRFLDPEPMPHRCLALAGAWFKNDEQLQRDHHERPQGAPRRTMAALALILRHLGALRQARMIYCLDGAHYALLLLLARTGLFNTGGKIIRRVAFHDSAWRKLAARLRAAPAAFQIECITLEQHASASAELGAGRVVMRPWKIDTGWFQPDTGMPKTRALLPGNISRDESIVAPLLQRGLSITRVARSEALRSRFAEEIANPRFELVTNVSHRDYLAHLRAAPAVLLPILPCDGSAGLTAALEAIATGVPVLANRSMGLVELFAECEYPVPMLQSLEPDEWAQAFLRIQAEEESGGFLAALEHSRRLLLRHHRILPAGDDWARIFDDAFGAGCHEGSTTPRTAAVPA